MKFFSFPLIIMVSSIKGSASANVIASAPSVLRGGASGSNHRILQEEEIGVFVIKEIEYDPDEQSSLRKLQRGGFGGGSRPDRTMNIGLEDGTFYEIKNAKQGWEDGMKSGRDIIAIPKGALMKSDGSIDVQGKQPTKWSGNKPQKNVGNGLFQGTRNLTERTPEQEHNLANLHRQLQTNSIGTKTVLAVKAVGNNGEYSFTPAQLSDYVFGAGSLKSQYNACSYGQLEFNPTPNRAMSTNPNDGVTTSISDGVLTLKVDVTVTPGTDTDTTFGNALTSKINQVFGVSSPRQLADHVMYCLPPDSFSGIAYAYLNSWNSVYKNEWCNHLSGLMHEIGHNLDYSHAGEGSNSYGDRSGYMGISYSQNNGPLMCFNAAKSWQTGWYANGSQGDKTMVVDPSAGDCFEEDLYGVAGYGDSASSVVLVKINDASATDYYVTFNAAYGINSGTQEAANQVTVTETGAEGISRSESSLLAKLGSNGSWSRTIDDKTMQVQVLSINGPYARVRISESGGACSPTPLPTPAPTLPPGSPPAVTTNELSTTFANGNGSIGNFFKVSAGTDLDITRFSVHTSNTGFQTVKVWTREGDDYASFTTNSAAWTEIFNQQVNGLGRSQVTQLPKFNQKINVQAGTYRCFYVTVSGGIRYTNGSGEGNVYANNAGELTFYEGKGSGGEFSSSTWSPRVWNGIIEYEMATSGPVLPPTPLPTNAPSTANPTTASPTTSNPTTASPTTVQPTTSNPTSAPTRIPTSSPSNFPTNVPTSNPTSRPTASPSTNPTSNPSSSPTSQPSSTPTEVSNPTSQPTSLPTTSPSARPNSEPTAQPTTEPTTSPTSAPTEQPTNSQPTTTTVATTTGVTTTTTRSLEQRIETLEARVEELEEMLMGA